MSTGVGSADRILGILDLFSERRLEWTAEEMIAELGYSRPTLYRYLKTLKDAGLLTQTGPHGMTLGPRVVELDFLMRKSDALLREGGVVLKELAALHPSTALLVRWYGNKLLCVASEVSTPQPKSSYPRGRPMPLARGAISRAILAHLPRRQMLAKIQENFEELRRLELGESVDEIAETLRKMRKGGAQIARGEVTDGVVGVAAPVFDASRAPVAALCMTINRETLDDAKLAQVSDAIWTSGERLSRALTEMRIEDSVLGTL